MNRLLRILRILFALFVFFPLTFCFVDLTGKSPTAWFSLAEIQLISALIAGSWVVFGAILLATVLFGRLYCSVVCPLGVFQDVVAWLSKKIVRRKYVVGPNRRYWRIGVLVATILFFAAGIPLLTLLEPYSVFGRIATHLFAPIYLAGNNILYLIFRAFGSYRFYNVDLILRSGAALATGSIFFVVIFWTAWRYGRLYCNTVCPVGTFLGLISRFSLLKIRLNPEKCVRCGLCSNVCKSACLDGKERSIDYSRCVDCFDCLGVCRKNALSYSIGFSTRRVPTQTSTNDVDQEKRNFLKSLSTATATVAAASFLSKALAQETQNVAAGIPETTSATNVPVSKDGTQYGLKPYRRERPLSPPGSITTDRFLSRCSGCHLCVVRCPANVLKPACSEYGLRGFMQPIMDFTHGFCNYDCTLCTEICPNDALLPLSKDEKHATQMGQVRFIQENCIVYAQETSCGACAEHCPTQAVTMIPYKGSLTIPQIDPKICVGCGGCEYICPARPYRAIYVEGNAVHQKAEAIQEAEIQNVEQIDFGF